MEAIGQVTLMGGSLFVNTKNPDWFAVLRKIDNAADTGFLKYDNQPMSSADIKKFIPNYSTLTWRKIDGLMEKDVWELNAVDREFSINLHPKNPKSFTPQSLVDAFLKQMQ